MTARHHRGRPAPRVRCAWTLLLTVALLLLAVSPGLAQPADAGADGEEASAAAVRLVVSELAGVLGPGTAVLEGDELDPRMRSDAVEDLALRVLVENAGDAALDRARLIVQLHPPVASRDDLQRALDAGPGTEPQHVLYDEPLRDGEPLRPGSVAGVAADFGPDEIAWTGGVHPLSVAVVRGTEVLAQADTAVVWLDRPVTEPVLTSIVWPLDDVPWRGVGGDYPRGADRAIQPGGRLDVLLRTLERRPDAPVVIAPAVHLLEDLRDRADGFTSLGRQADGQLDTRFVDPEDPPAVRARDTLQRLRAVARQLPFAPVTGSYADADVNALAQHGGDLTALGAEAAVEGRRRLLPLLDRAPDAAVHLAGGPLAPEVLDLIPGDQIVLPPDAVTDATGASPALRPLRSSSGRLLTGVVADRHISDSLAASPSEAGPIVDAQRVVAHTAQAWFQDPAESGRSLLVLPPDGWSPSAELAERLLDQLDDAPWLRLTTPSQQAVLGRRGAEPVELATATQPALSAAFASALEDAGAELAAVRTALPDDATTIGDRRPSELHDTLLRATSRWYLEGSPAEAEALVRDVRGTVEQTFGEVVVASGSRVTLTSDTGQIPVTLQRTRGGPIAVRVEVASQGRLLWPEGQRSETIVLTEGAAQTVSFNTRALSTGTFSVAVRVTDPSGAHTLERTTLSVRSAAISGPALAATGGAVLLLLLAGALRRRRPRRPRLEVVDDRPEPVGRP
ncbi:DUF6049 family protein [Egicoccus sp. AB-alg2]|uniref:DUF6049 family protein n=1 Tax=Egicoccus sp. AB-alg2 TaxID=3242693 RepID=UPI00359D5A24